MSTIEFCWNATSYISVLVLMSVAGACLGIFAAPYMQSRKTAVWAGAVYCAVMIALYVMPLQIDNILAYFTGTLAAFAVMCLKDRRNISQKIFLATTFFSLRWLSASMVGILDPYLDRILLNPKITAQIWLSYGLYVVVRILDIALWTLNLLLAILAINRAYEDKKRYMGGRELLLLSVPSLSGVAGYAVYHFYQYREELTEIYDLLCFFYYLISILAVLAIIVIFQRWKTSQEEREGQQLLESQIDNIKTHIEGVEKLYGDLRSLRHDMGNHIQMIERLMAAGNSAEASA